MGVKFGRSQIGKDIHSLSIGGVGLNRVEVTGDLRKLHYEEHHILCSPDIIRLAKSRRVRWVVHVVRMGRRKLQALVNKLEGKEPLGRPRR
jgi:hypothetical protein